MNQLILQNPSEIFQFLFTIWIFIQTYLRKSTKHQYVKEKIYLSIYWTIIYFHRFVNNFSEFILCKMNDFNVFNMVGLFDIFVASWNIEILIDSRMYVLYTLKIELTFKIKIEINLNLRSNSSLKLRSNLRGSTSVMANFRADKDITTN